MDAIQLLKKDHRTVEQLFKRFERAHRSSHHARMSRAVRTLVKELSIHAAVEEQLVYPTLRRASKDVVDDVLESLEEHHLVKLTLAELQGMSPRDERYAAKVTVLIESVRHHVKEEEEDLLPRLRKALAPKALRELGRLIATAKRTAPTRPHPSAPDTPPGNLFSGALAALYDRSRDALRGMTERKETGPMLH